MKNFEEFMDIILEGVREKAGGKFQVSIMEILQNNGTRLTGITAVPSESRTGPCGYSVEPCMHLDGYYGEYKDGNISFSETVDEIYGQLMIHKNDLQDVDMTAFLDWDIVRNHIYVKLINADRNKELLKMVPHRLFLDLAAVYYVIADGVVDGQRTGTILVSNNHMPLWKQRDEEKFYEAAVHNMCSEGTPVFENIWNVIARLSQYAEDTAGSLENPANTGMYVLTNRRKRYGASEILDKNILKEISDKLESNLIILPSSVHEVIILAEDKHVEYRELADMVKEINATELRAEEFLSDHVYVYKRKFDALTIVA